MVREYIVTLHKHEDLESFYNDMETPGGSLYIPQRAVDIAHRRPISRSTHYFLTDEEAEQLTNDPRVLCVELNFRDQGISIVPMWEQTGNWNKSTVTSRTNNNWALKRCTNGEQVPNWGNNGITNITDTVRTTSSGKNVDVVIVDGPLNPNHPEFAKNPDGTGGSRVIEYDWFRNHNAEVDPFSSRPNYTYGIYTNPSYAARTNHGMHVAGTVAGNTQGWARDANIYHISPYSDDPNFAFPASYPIWLDYIRAWHRSKPINPATGRKNPTITNHSYGSVYSIVVSSITSVRVRGVTYPGPFTNTDLKQAGIHASGSIYYALSGSNPLSGVYQDIVDCINEGIIVVCAAGNSNALFLTDTEHPDYDNYISGTTETGLTSDFRYNRPNSFVIPGPTDANVIVVGSLDSNTTENKASYSNRGHRVDIYAPGSQIMSALQSGSTITDIRNTSYLNGKLSGTSMASPQVAGVLACVAEQWPTMSQAQAREYIVSVAKTDQISDPGGTFFDTVSLLGSENKYLNYKFHRPLTGQVGPSVSQGTRPTSGQVWPRTKIYRYGR